MTAFVYMLRCANGSLYTGWTNDLKRRLARHQAGVGAKFTHAFKVVDLVYYEELASQHEAMRREYELKHLRKAQKEDLVRQFRAAREKSE